MRVLAVIAAVTLAGLVAPVSIHAEHAAVIPPDALIYVDSASGLDTYLAAALERKHVPLAVTTDKAKADYALDAVSGVRLVNLRTGDVVFGWPLDGKSTFNGRQTAEACAKRLAASLPPSEKHKSSKFSKEPALDF